MKYYIALRERWVGKKYEHISLSNGPLSKAEVEKGYLIYLSMSDLTTSMFLKMKKQDLTDLKKAIEFILKEYSDEN